MLLVMRYQASGEKEDDDVQMILAVQQVDITNDVSIVQSSDGRDR